MRTIFVQRFSRSSATNRKTEILLLLYVDMPQFECIILANCQKDNLTRKRRRKSCPGDRKTLEQSVKSNVSSISYFYLKFLCLSVKIFLSTKPIQFSILEQIHIGPLMILSHFSFFNLDMVLGYFMPLTSS